MNNFQLAEFFLSHPATKDMFLGVFSSDKIPQNIMQRPAFIIANTAEYKQVGEHWVWLFLPKTGAGEYFDSLGEESGDFSQFLLRHSFGYMTNTFRLQDFDSSSCGLFCILFALERSKNISFSSFLSEFSRTNLKYNEQIVRKKTCRFLKGLHLCAQ